MPPDTHHAPPAAVRRSALSGAVASRLDGPRDDAYWEALAESAGWAPRDFWRAVERVVAAAEGELARPRQVEMWDAA